MDSGIAQLYQHHLLGKALKASKAAMPKQDALLELIDMIVNKCRNLAQ